MIRVSNFGNLAVMMLENPGAYDRAELDTLVDPTDLSLARSCLDAEGYVLVPEEPLWEPCRSGNRTTVESQTGFLEARPDWWIRFFDYL